VSGLRLLSPGKLNLFLHITGRRPDGYHELQTLFQLLDYGDAVTLTDRSDSRIELDCPAVAVAPEQNLAWKAARLLQQRTGCARGAAITIAKRLPAGGGLGGGSSNAATVLLALNHLWELGLSLEHLAELGLELGADVPVFVMGRTAWAEGIGERLQPVELPEQHYLVISPGCEVSTREVFSHRQLTRNTSAIKIAAFFEGGGRNDCEAVVRLLYPDVDAALDWLGQYGQARLTGTGACIFAAFNTAAEARGVLERLPNQWRGFVARGINHSPVHAELR